MTKLYSHDSYWKFTGDPREDAKPLAYIDGWDSGGFDRFRLRQGKPLSTQETKAIKSMSLWAVRDGGMPDYFNSMSPDWHIISERFVALLKEMEVEDEYELIPAPLFWKDTFEAIPGYHILNPLTMVECMDKERSKAEYDDRIDKWYSRAFQHIMYLHGSRIPTGAKLFLLKENRHYTVFRGDLVAEYYKRGFTGAWFMHMPTEDEEYIDNEDAS